MILGHGDVLPNFCCGSTADLQRHAHLRPLLRVKRTSNVCFLSPKRSYATYVGCWVISGRGAEVVGTSALSQNKTFRSLRCHQLSSVQSMVSCPRTTIERRRKLRASKSSLLYTNHMGQTGIAFRLAAVSLVPGASKCRWPLCCGFCRASQLSQAKEKPPRVRDG